MILRWFSRQGHLLLPLNFLSVSQSSPGVPEKNPILVYVSSPFSFHFPLRAVLPPPNPFSTASFADRVSRVCSRVRDCWTLISPGFTFSFYNAFLFPSSEFQYDSPLWRFLQLPRSLYMAPKHLSLIVIFFSTFLIPPFLGPSFSTFHVTPVPNFAHTPGDFFRRGRTSNNPPIPFFSASVISSYLRLRIPLLPLFF